jgi:tRNA(Ile)-lysidine synthase TilS/MesJ
VNTGDKVAVALSGGCDSMALAKLLSDEIGTEKVVTFTVDHQLYANSREDALAVADRAKAMGMFINTI